MVSRVDEVWTWPGRRSQQTCDQAIELTKCGPGPAEEANKHVIRQSHFFLYHTQPQSPRVH